MDNYDFNRLEAKLDRLIALKEAELKVTASAGWFGQGHYAVELADKQMAGEVEKATIWDVSIPFIICIGFIALCVLCVYLIGA